MFHSSQWRAPVAARLNRVKLTNLDGKTLDTILPGKMFYVESDVSVTIPWDSLGYLLVWLNHSSNSMGNSLNKGGRFSAFSNYPLNLNLFFGGYLIFERSQEGSLNSMMIKPESSGVYSTLSKAHTTINPKTGKIRIGLKLLPQALAGPWRVSACLVYSTGKDEMYNIIEKISDVKTYRFFAAPESRYPSSAKWVLLCLFSLGAVIVFYMYVRKNVKISGNARNYLSNHKKSMEWDLILNYVNGNYSVNSSVEDLLAQTKLSRNRFYEIMKERNQKFSRLINEARINRAKAIFSGNEFKNITEVGKMVGFEDPKHFYKTFKEIEGITPSEFLFKESKR